METTKKLEKEYKNILENLEFLGPLNQAQRRYVYQQMQKRKYIICPKKLKELETPEDQGVKDETRSEVE